TSRQPVPGWTWVAVGLLVLFLIAELVLLNIPPDIDARAMLFMVGLILVPHLVLAAGVGLKRLDERLPATRRWIPLLPVPAMTAINLFGLGIGLSEFLKLNADWPIWLLILVPTAALGIEAWRRTRWTPRWWLLVLLPAVTMGVSLGALLLNVIFH